MLSEYDMTNDLAEYFFDDERERSRPEQHDDEMIGWSMKVASPVDTYTVRY